MTDTLIQFTTTTVIATSTNLTFPPESTKHPIPIAAIAGGVAGGALLATLVTVGWIWWGKSIKKSQVQQRHEVESRLQTLRNTRHNASISQPQIDTYLPLVNRPPEPKVKFASFRVKSDKSDKPVPQREFNGPDQDQKLAVPSRPRRLQAKRKLRRNGAPVAPHISQYPAAPAPSGNTRVIPEPSFDSVYTTASEGPQGMPLQVASDKSHNLGKQPDNNMPNGSIDAQQMINIRNLLNSQSYSNPFSTYELQRQSASTYNTALSRLTEDDR
ncbi:hypothetical protein AMATHDRAFT_50127 [Amanita thiersii Skay4041]|uniref:Uncharacterized protein n=1 Tax=Amanita thiersii Skay4041 TaxID=703135 RepID=A0A2A9NC72_9AGAR|nr:hypothetical protein AMATHDRAFT_50127 [Amanita thiersii Skay4041]